MSEPTPALWPTAHQAMLAGQSPAIPGPVDDDGPECDLCGKTNCPDADLPGFSAPVACAYAPIYHALRHDRCEYGCGRDITKDTIRRDIVPTVESLRAGGDR